MKKIIAYFFVITGLAIMVVSTSRPLMKEISEARESAPWGAWWGPHQVSNAGDLARMAYLEKVKKFKDTVNETYTGQGDGNKQIDLYMYGDSYVKDIPDSAFYGLNAFHFARRDYTNLEYNLDPTKHNILIIEIGERFARTYFYVQDSIYAHVKRAEPTACNMPAHIPLLVQDKQYAGFDFDIDVLFNDAINQNIEYNVFTYNFLTGIRNFKASMNYYLFNRGSGDVVISDDGNFLFIRESVNNALYSSSYVEVPEPFVSYFISILNPIYDHYRNEGFDEVYLSIVPNPATVLQPAMYNGFLPDLQNPQRGYPLKMPVIDMYQKFSGEDAHLYFKHGDTHWNMKGTHVWIDEVNKLLHHWDTTAVQ